MSEFDPEAFLNSEPAPDLPVITDELRPTTYGPGSPNPTPADLKETVGNADNQLKWGDVALQPEIAHKYGLKTGDQFIYQDRVFTYADTPNARVGNVIDIYHPAKEFDPNAFLQSKPITEQQPISQPSVESGSEHQQTFDPQAFLASEPVEPSPKEETQKERSGVELPSFAPTPIPQVSTSVPTVPMMSNREVVGSPMQPVVAQGIGQAIPQPAPTPIGTLPPTWVRQIAEMPPLLSPQQMMPVVKAGVAAGATLNPALAINLEALRRLNPQMVQGIEGAAADQLSGLTAPSNAAIIPAMMVPGVPEAYGAYQLAKTPQAWSNVNDAIQRYGLGSEQATRAMTNEVVRLGTAVAAPVAGRFAKGFREAAAQPPKPPVPSDVVAGSTLPPEPPEGVSPLQVKSRADIADRIIAKGPGGGANTEASLIARQASNLLRHDFAQQYPESTFKDLMKPGTKLQQDLEAATFIEEANGLLSNLKKDADLVRTAKNKKLAAKYSPVLDYALANFDRLSKLSHRYSDLMRNQMADDAASGINYEQRKNYVTHALKDEPSDSLMSFFTDGGSSGTAFTRYFTKRRDFNTLAEAIHEGFDPRSVNLADLAEKRIADSNKLILEKALFQEMRSTAGPDGRPAVAPAGERPRGYQIIDAGGTTIASHPDYAGLWKAIYGDSALRRTPIGRAFMRAVGIEKSYTLALDTFHGMVGLMKGAAYGGKGMRLGFERGLSIWEYPDEMLGDLVKRGDMTQSDADLVKKSRPVVMAPLRNGLNVNTYADNLVGQLHATFPGTRGVNDWIFKRVFRGSMIQAAYANMLRNMDRYPELSVDEAGRRTAKEMNEVFGNLMNQSILKDKTVRDALNVGILASNWFESQIRSEFRGYGQLAKVPYDAVFNGKFRMGTVAQGQATLAMAYLLGNQIINYATTGHSTFQNPEGHRLSAYLPVGRGLYLDPLSLSAPLVDRLNAIWSRQGEKATAASVMSEFARSKLSRIGQALVTFGTQTDWRGRKLTSNKEVAAGTIGALVPEPILGSMFIEPDAKSPYGVKARLPQADQFVKQLLQSLGQRATIDYRGPLAPTTGQPTQARIIQPRVTQPRIVKPRIVR